MEIKSYIIAEADKLFSKHGFKSVTMDDIAKILGMSKKTIYQHFEDKNELVTILIQQKLAAQDCVIEDSQNHAKNAVDEIMFGVTNIQEMLSNRNPRIFHELQKYHPKAWFYFKEFRDTKIKKSVIDNLNRGIEEGLYRSDIKIDLLTKLRLKQIDLLFSNYDEYTSDKYNLADVMVEFTEHFLYGITTIEGHKIINEIKENLQKNQN